MRAAIYLRVSTGEQTTDNQERDLRATAERAGHEVVAVYRDAGRRTAQKPAGRLWWRATLKPRGRPAPMRP